MLKRSDLEGKHGEFMRQARLHQGKADEQSSYWLGKADAIKELIDTEFSYRCGYCGSSTEYDGCFDSYRCKRCGRTYYPGEKDEEFKPVISNNTIYHQDDYAKLKASITRSKQYPALLKRSEWLKKRKEIRENLAKNDSNWNKLSTQGQYNLVNDTMQSLGYVQNRKLRDTCGQCGSAIETGKKLCAECESIGN